MTTREYNKRLKTFWPGNPVTKSMKTKPKSINETMKGQCHKGMTPAEDARFMLGVCEICIEKKITIEPRSPLHRLLLITIKRFRKNNQ